MAFGGAFSNAFSSAFDTNPKLIEFSLITYLEDKISNIMWEWMRIPEDDELPCVVVTFTTKQREPVLAGCSGIVTADVTLEAFTQDSKDVLYMTERIRKALYGFTGDMNEVNVLGITFPNESSQYVDSQDASDEGFYRIEHNYVIRYEEAIPEFAS